MCPQSRSLATVVVLSPAYTAITWVYKSQYTVGKTENFKCFSKWCILLPLSIKAAVPNFLELTGVAKCIDVDGGIFEKMYLLYWVNCTNFVT
jgi:hypothetical protein